MALGDQELKIATAVAAAIATAVSAVLTGVISVYFKRQADAHIERIKGEQNQVIERIKANLSVENKSKEARIDYEYEARKRLYKEVEPLLFSAHIAVTSILGRLKALAARTREGHISRDLKKTWMADQYFQRSTVHRLFLPMTYHRLLSRRVSQLDLTLEPLIGRKFMALGIFEDIFVDHFNLAQMETSAIPYDPYAEITDKERKSHPEKYGFQGLVRGEVERLISATISSDANGQAPLEWFRFDEEIRRTDSELSIAYVPVRELVVSFHPITHPVVWRAFISFFLLANFYIGAKNFTVDEYDRCVELVQWPLFDYRRPNEQKSISESVPRDHFEAARCYIRGRIMEEYQTLAHA